MLALPASPTDVPAGSTALHVSFIALALTVAALVPAAVFWSAVRAQLDAGRIRKQTLVAVVATAAWLAITAAAAGAGLLHFSPPPTMLLVFVATFAIAAGLAGSPLGLRMATHLPIAALVGFQSFRILVELLLHRAYGEGLIPVQMSYSGHNFDIVSGLTAATVAIWLAMGGRSARVVFLWNTLGSVLLANILGVALLSAPTPARVFMNEPSSAWITQAPWVWLPAVMVLAAVTGHALVYRRLVSTGVPTLSAISR